MTLASDWLKRPLFDYPLLPLEKGKYLGLISQMESDCLTFSIYFKCAPPQLNIHGGSSLQNRSKRFEEAASEVPGPGAYSLLPSLGQNAFGAVSARLCRKPVGIWVKM